MSKEITTEYFALMDDKTSKTSFHSSSVKKLKELIEDGYWKMKAMKPKGLQYTIEDYLGDQRMVHVKLVITPLN